MAAKAHLGATGRVDNRLRRIAAVYLKTEPCECDYLKLSICLQRQSGMAHFNSQIGEVDLARCFSTNNNLANVMRIGTDDFSTIRGARYLTYKKIHAAVTSRKTR